MFSEMVDNVAARSGRSDPKSRANIIGYTRAVMRESQVMAFFDRDFTEDALSATSSPFIWPRPKQFRRMQTVAYPVSTLGRKVYPDPVVPGKQTVGKVAYYYAGPTYYVFVGVSEGSPVEVGYYSYFRRYAYYSGQTGDERPAVYNTETEVWSYWDGNEYVPTLGTEAQDEAAQELVGNWMLLDWYDLVFEGATAKLWTAVDDVRAPKTFASYTDMQKSLLDGEATSQAPH